MASINLWSSDAPLATINRRSRYTAIVFFLAMLFICNIKTIIFSCYSYCFMFVIPFSCHQLIDASSIIVYATMCRRRLINSIFLPPWHVCSSSSCLVVFCIFLHVLRYLQYMTLLFTNGFIASIDIFVIFMMNFIIYWTILQSFCLLSRSSFMLTWP